MPDHIPDGRAEFTGRIALVTGAAQGIGAAVATALAAEGAHVVATDKAAPGDAPGVTGNGGAVTGRAMDVTDRSCVDATVDRIERELGPLDVLVNVAGILRPGPAARTRPTRTGRTPSPSTPPASSTPVAPSPRTMTAGAPARSSPSAPTPRASPGRVWPRMPRPRPPPRCSPNAWASSSPAAASAATSSPPAPPTPPCSGPCGPTRPRPERVIAGDLETYRTGIPLRPHRRTGRHRRRRRLPGIGPSPPHHHAGAVRRRRRHPALSRHRACRGPTRAEAAPRSTSHRSTPPHPPGSIENWSPRADGIRSRHARPHGRTGPPRRRRRHLAPGRLHPRRPVPGDPHPHPVATASTARPARRRRCRTASRPPSPRPGRRAVPTPSSWAPSPSTPPPPPPHRPADRAHRARRSAPTR